MHSDVMLDVLLEVAKERRRQHEKWGEQNHPDGTGPRSYGPTLVDHANMARGLCENAFKNGHGTYAHILYEEVCEAFDESDPRKLREELVQVAAVAVAWIEKIDRDLAKAQPTPHPLDAIPLEPRRCTTCGNPEDDHHYRHPFSAPDFAHRFSAAPMPNRVRALDAPDIDT